MRWGSKKLHDLLYCNVQLVAMIWNRAFNISEGCLCIIFIVSTLEYIWLINVNILWSKRFTVWNFTALLQSLNTDNLMTVTNIRVGPEFRDKRLMIPGMRKRSSRLFFLYPSNHSNFMMSESVDQIYKWLSFSVKMTTFERMSRYIYI